MSRAARIAIALLIVSVGIAACGGSNAPSSPSAPAPVVAQPAPEPKPAPEPTGLQPTLTSVTPNVVSTSGSWGTIRGSRFEQGATLKFANETFFAQVVDSTEIRFSATGTHAVGTVDVTVTNPGGFSATLPGGYTYALPDAFNFDGDWIAHAGEDFEIDMRFTIQNHVLVSIACGTDASPTMSAPLQIKNGSFSLASDDGFSLSATIVSTQTSFGQVNAPGCGSAHWWADKADLSR
jgi:hypothetical protein